MDNRRSLSMKLMERLLLLWLLLLVVAVLHITNENTENEGYLLAGASIKYSIATCLRGLNIGRFGRSKSLRK